MANREIELRLDLNEALDRMEWLLSESKFVKSNLPSDRAKVLIEKASFGLIKIMALRANQWVNFRVRKQKVLVLQ